MFYNAIHAKYPSVAIISSLCINNDLPGATCQPGSSLNNPPAGVIADLHLYQSSDATVGLFSAFDHLPRDHPILVGEYAAIYPDNEGGNTQLDNPTLQSATSEAVMFLGLERNSDLVMGVAHGALMKSLNDEPDNVAIIKHNADTLVLSYSYFVTQMFAQNFGSRTAPTTADAGFGPLYWSSTVDNGKYFVKVVNYKGADSTPVTVTVSGSNANSARLITLTGPNGSSTNTLGSSTHSLKETTVHGGGGTFSFTLQGSYVVAILVV
jgi:alpha-N-arabinofuranosidase